ncbi:hypothetical protein Clacol_001744 [Clathrus columnatus]|uniref:ABC transporter domain-containing protein n=1 Tax=Clathrus columnatus TaxID=1419009 RepID=A0AAV5A281_9AGAM|nr:hypothetical protein Clacol_001744 [Clathrus columnatus]
MFSVTALEAMNPVVRSDVVVSAFLDSVGGYRHKTRRDVLLDILDVDLSWHMHAISDGERRRVQLVMGLMSEWDVLLLDEVTVDLDVLVRHDLLDFLKRENTDDNTRGSMLHAISLKWLKEDRQYRRQQEEAGNMSKSRGARRDQTVPSDSEIFYRKYDYAH